MTVRHPARRPGMSLIEVLLSLVIFLMSLTAIARLIDAGSDRALDTMNQNTATRLAQSKLAEVEAGAIGITGGTGEFDTEPGWTWTVEAGSASVPNVYPVTVRVSRQVGGRTFEVTLTQMVYDPNQLNTADEIEPPATTSTTSGSGQ